MYYGIVKTVSLFACVRTNFMLNILLNILPRLERDLRTTTKDDDRGIEKAPQLGLSFLMGGERAIATSRTQGTKFQKSD